MVRQVARHGTRQRGGRVSTMIGGEMEKMIRALRVADGEEG